MRAALDVADEGLFDNWFDPVEKVLHTKVRASSRRSSKRSCRWRCRRHATLKAVVGHRYGHRLQSLTTGPIIRLAGNLGFLGCGASHASSSLSNRLPRLLSASRISRVSPATTSFQSRRLAAKLPRLLRRPYRLRATSPRPQGRLWTSGNRGSGRSLTAPQLGDALLAAQALQDDASLLFCRKLPAHRPPDVFYDLFRRFLHRPRFLSCLMRKRLRWDTGAAARYPKYARQRREMDRFCLGHHGP
jgi:hypothetical protein